MRAILLSIFVIVGLQIYGQADTTNYHFTVKLLKVEQPPPYCGTMAWALTQKFEIIETDFAPMKKGYPVLLNQPCPEFLGKDFFLLNRVYHVTVAQTINSPFGYAIVNNYKKENLPVFWIAKIEPITNQIQ